MPCGRRATAPKRSRLVRDELPDLVLMDVIDAERQRIRGVSCDEAGSGNAPDSGRAR